MEYFKFKDNKNVRYQNCGFEIKQCTQENVQSKCNMSDKKKCQAQEIKVKK